MCARADPYLRRIGSLTLTGSAIAFGKLHGILGAAPLSLPGERTRSSTAPMTTRRRFPLRRSVGAQQRAWGAAACWCACAACAGKNLLNLAMLGGSVYASWVFMTTAVPATAINMLVVVAVSCSSGLWRKSAANEASSAGRPTARPLKTHVRAGPGGPAGPAPDGGHWRRRHARGGDAAQQLLG